MYIYIYKLYGYIPVILTNGFTPETREQMILANQGTILSCASSCASSAFQSHRVPMRRHMFILTFNTTVKPYKKLSQSTSRNPSVLIVLPTASRLKSHSPKILLRRGRIFCLRRAPTLQAILHHRKEAGATAPRWDFLSVPGSHPASHPSPQKRSREARSVKPGLLKKPLVAKSYYGVVGISLKGLACHSRCPYL